AALRQRPTARSPCASGAAWPTPATASATPCLTPAPPSPSDARRRMPTRPRALGAPSTRTLAHFPLSPGPRRQLYKATTTPAETNHHLSSIPSDSSFILHPSEPTLRPMATERLISPARTDLDEEPQSNALRPSRLDEYIGQRELAERLRIGIEAVRQRDEPLDHILLHGPPGLGKTTLAHVIANELGTNVHATSGPALTRGTDLASALTRLQARDVLFIDEIHRLPVAVEEFIYPAMEDYRIDVTLDSGMSARTVQIRCQPFTLIGATTRAGLLSGPLRSRFGITHHLKYYDEADLLSILQRSARLMSLEAADSALESIARRS